MLDEDEERALSRVRPHTRNDQLSPRPPHGWSLVFRYWPPNNAHELVYLGCWVYLVSHAQAHGKRHYRIAQAPCGGRVLLVSPSLAQEFADRVDSLDADITDGSGGQLICEPQQARASAALARRVWRKQPIHERISIVEELGIECDPLAVFGDQLPDEGCTPDWEQSEIAYTLLTEYA